MTRDELLERLRTTRALFDSKVGAIPWARMDRPIPGSIHRAKEIVAHVSAYEDLIVERLEASRAGHTTAFDRDRVSWEAFNERVWSEAADLPTGAVLDRAGHVFTALEAAVSELSDAEVSAAVGATAALDPAWLDGHAPWELIETDTTDHYVMHLAALDAAAEA